MSTVTRIAYSKNLNAGKLAALDELACRLGELRTEIWNRYGSISGAGIDHRTIRNSWMAEGRVINIPARLWKETLRDTKADIEASCESAKAKARRAIRRHTKDEKEQRRLYRLLKFREWTKDPYLCRIMRKYWCRGHTSVSNQIVLDKQCYATFIKDGQAWIDVSSLKLRKRISVPLNTNVVPIGTIRLMLRDGRVEVHHTVKAKVYTKGSGSEIIGIDKGYTEAFVDSTGEHYGEGLGKLLSAESNYLKAKYQSRNKLKAIAESKPHKRDRIEANNLGRKKLNRRKQAHTSRVRTLVFQSAHQLADKANTIVCEDLTSPIKSKSFGKNQNRRLSGWVKGIMAEALNSLSHRRSSSVHLINCAYTSQIDSTTGLFTGTRKGDRFYCESGVVLQADYNAAVNVLARLFDDEINQWTPYREVKFIVQERTDRQRRELIASGL